MRELILGGVRSGKSRHAEARAAASGLEVVYVATARPLDDGMRARIAAHRARRPAGWRTVEAPLHLAAALAREAAPERCLIVDCLTLWLTNLLLEEGGAHLEHEVEALLAALPGLPGRVILVANEASMGVIPEGALARRFLDEAGRLHQEVAARCERVTLMMAGLPMVLKGGES